MTDQQDFWKGEFGDAWTERNQVDPKTRHPFFEELLSTHGIPDSVCELGANRGYNLLAIHDIAPAVELVAVEINKDACSQIPEHIHSFNTSVENFEPDRQYDLVFCCGFLVHVHPKRLEYVYDKMLDISKKQILIIEYFNAVPIEVEYRGYKNQLFVRDFAKEMGEKANFVEGGIASFSTDPLSWSLFEK